jgi:hypothetical protein
MFKKKPILEYKSSLDYYPNTIIPAKNNIPDWYKKIPKWKNNKMFNENMQTNPTVKLCVPFLDCFINGYFITLPYDIHVLKNENAPTVTWPNSVKNPPGIRENVAHENLVPEGHYPIEFTWNYCVAYKIPKGYSALFTHPLNRNELPFTTLSGIIDGGIVMSAHGNAPFYIKKNFEGIIPQGTPIAQLILFRQEDWKSKQNKDLIKIGQIHNDSGQNVFFGWYKKTFWKKKNYD